MNIAKIIESRQCRNGRPRRASEQRLTTIDAFRARCEARALLYAAGELNLSEAVDALQTAAVAMGLVDQLGQDTVQAIMAAAFGKGRHHAHV